MEPLPDYPDPSRNPRIRIFCGLPSMAIPPCKTDQTDAKIAARHRSDHWCVHPCTSASTEVV